MLSSSNPGGLFYVNTANVFFSSILQETHGNIQPEIISPFQQFPVFWESFLNKEGFLENEATRVQ